MSTDMTETRTTPAVLEGRTTYRGATFSPAERKAMGLTARLPSAVQTGAAVDDGAAACTTEDLMQAVHDAMWQPDDADSAQ
jgi:hypothetical protein